MVSVRGSSSATMLSYSVIIALLGCFVLSADAIRCHQCNSHLDEDCNSLRLNVPRGIRDEQYLENCESTDEEPAFCRKIVVKIISTGDTRIVRGCGTRKVDLRGRNDTCFAADNEGFFETFCACFTDGCNSAPMSGQMNVGVALGAAIVMVTLAAFRRG